MNKKALIIIGVAVVFFVALALYNSHSRPADQGSNQPWNTAMTVGAADAPNTIVEYGDYFCEFCTKFYEQASSDDFKKKYLDTGKVRVETRPITVLAGEHSLNAEAGAEAAFCAADQDKYHEFSDHIIPRIKHDFFDKGIGVKQMNGAMLSQPKTIEKLPQSYYDESASAVKMNVDQFSDCMINETHQSTIAKNTQKAISNGVRGLPHILVNDYVSSGFAGGWSNFELMLKAGGIDTK